MRADFGHAPTSAEIYLVEVMHFALLVLCWGLVVEDGYFYVEELPEFPSILSLNFAEVEKHWCRPLTFTTFHY